MFRALLCTLFALSIPTITMSPVLAQGLGLPGPGGCYEDAYEPNAYSMPTLLLDSVVLSDANICSSDDWYRVDLSPGQVAIFELEFFHRYGDIDVSLHHLEGYGQFDISDSATNRELLRYVAFEESSILLRVYGFSGATNSYVLTFSKEDYSRDCPQSSIPAQLELDRASSGHICLGQTLEWTIESDEDEPFEVVLVSDPNLGDLDIAVYDEDGRRLAVSSSRGYWERMRVFPEEDGPIRLVVSPYAEAFGPFDLSLVRLDPDVDPLEVTGQLTFERRVPTERGLKDTQTVAPEGILVELVRLLDGYPIARTTTDEDGRYRFRVEFADPESLVLRVSAQLEHPDYRLRVIPAVDSDSAHQLASDPLASYERTEDRLELDVSLSADHELTGALNIATVSRDALELVTSVERRSRLLATIVWDKEQAHPCGSCYTGGMVLLGGSDADPDEFDDAVIVHELGHFIVDELSWDDSPGGSHDGTRTDPLVAFGEGIATAFALIALGDSHYVDSTLTRRLAYEDLESVPFPEAFGTGNRRLAGPVSEWTTAALVWDFHDPPSPTEQFDRVEIPAEALLRMLFNPLIDRRRIDLGAFGMELADLVNTLRCTFPSDASAIEQLVRGHQRFPIELFGKDKCEWSTAQ